MLRLRADREALNDLRRHVVSEIATVSRGSAVNPLPFRRYFSNSQGSRVAGERMMSMP